MDIFVFAILIIMLLCQLVVSYSKKATLDAMQQKLDMYKRELDRQDKIIAEYQQLFKDEQTKYGKQQQT